MAAGAPRSTGPWRWILPILAGLVGAVVGIALFGHVGARIGPFDTTFGLRPGVTGSTVVRLAPLGTIELDSHDAPVEIDLRVDELRRDDAVRIAENPEVLDGLEDEVAGDVAGALRRLALRGLVVATVGGALAALAVSGRWRMALVGGATGLAVVIGVALPTLATFNPGAVAEPRYTGLLTVAPTAVGDVEEIVDRFGEYRAQLTALVGNVARLYRAAEGLPSLEVGDDTVRIVHVSDIHLNPQAFDLIDLIVDEFDIDAVVDTGDITDWGTTAEDALLERIGEVGVPYVWVRGNHDSRATQGAVGRLENAVVLDGEARTVAGLRLWGIGDPRYTPRKDRPDPDDPDRDEAQTSAPAVARMVEDQSEPVDVVMVHDERLAADLGGGVPLILSGHTHEARQDEIGDSLLLVEGSTGGAGLRGLEGEEPKPLEASVLYFDPSTDRLVAYDRVTVDGLGGSGARIERHTVVGER